MKYACTAILALSLCAGLAQAATNVPSANAVGYVKISVPSNGYALVRMDFENIDGGPIVLKDILGDQLPQNSLVHYWDRANSTYATSTKSGRGGWDDATNEVERGQGFWLEVPAAAATADVHDVYLMGEVPDSQNMGGTNSFITGLSGINPIGYPYPVAVAWTSTTLAADTPFGTKIHIWETTNYATYTKSGRGSGWDDATDVIISPGQAYWLELPAGITNDWIVGKPYSYPN